MVNINVSLNHRDVSRLPSTMFEALGISPSETKRRLGKERPLDWLSQLATEGAAFRAGVLSLIKLKNPRTAAKNQEDPKSSIGGPGSLANSSPW